MILTEEFVKTSMVYSEALIEEARKKNRKVFDLARNAGDKIFYKVDKLLVNEYVYAINNVEYKLKELEYLGKVEGNDTAIYDELIEVIKEQFGNMFKMVIEDIQLWSRLKKL